jgi:hypothetical protein
VRLGAILWGNPKGMCILSASCDVRVCDYEIVFCREFVVSRLRSGWHWRAQRCSRV